MKLSRSILFSVLVLAICLLPACKKTPKGVLDKKEMTELLIDFHKGEGLIDLQRSSYYSDSLRKALKQSILLAHGVTQEQLDTSFVWYGNHIEDYVEIYDEVIKRLEAEMKAPGAPTVIYAVGDSIDVWPGANSYRVDWQMPMRNVPYLLAADDNWQPGDNYTLQFKLSNPRIDGEKVKATIFASYPGGDVEYISDVATTDGWTRVRLITDSTRIPEHIFGTLEINPLALETLYLDSVALVRTRNIPETYYRRGYLRFLSFDPSKAKADEEKIAEPDSVAAAAAPEAPEPARTARPRTAPKSVNVSKPADSQTKGVPKAGDDVRRQAPKEAKNTSTYRPGYDKPAYLNN